MYRSARLFGFAVTIAIVAYGVWRLDLSQVGIALGSADYALLPMSVAATFSSYLLRTARWRLILAPSRDLSIRTLYGPLMLGFMANNLLPARMGEFVRAFSLNRSTGISKTLALGTVLLERVFDGLALVTILVGLAIVGALPAIGGPIGYIAGGLFVVAAVASWLFITNEAVALRILGALVRPLPEAVAEFAQKKAQSFADSLRALRRPGTLLKIAALSAAVWSCEALSYFLLLLGFSSAVATAVALPAAFFLTVVINLGIMIPSAPGYVGTFEGAGVTALVPFGVAPESALALVIVSHAVQWLLVTGIGLALLARGGLSWRGLRAVERT